jgi:hypothetical protein
MCIDEGSPCLSVNRNVAKQTTATSSVPIEVRIRRRQAIARLPSRAALPRRNSFWALLRKRHALGVFNGQLSQILPTAAETSCRPVLHESRIYDMKLSTI